jgi:hypothetical protein
MSPTLDRDLGAGSWIWDPQQAYQQEGIKRAKQIQACGDIQYANGIPMGWCNVGNGFAVPLNTPNQCPTGSLITDAASCPPSPAPSSSSISGSCQQGANGSLPPACIQNIANGICGPQGTLSQALGGGGYASSSADFNARSNFLSQQRQFTLHDGIVNGTAMTVNDAMTSIQGLRSLANASDGSRATQAAQNLCTGVPFDPCALSPSDTGPFDPTCITQAALAKGYSPKGALLPASSGMDYWNQVALRTWQGVLSNLDWYKGAADTPSTSSGLNQTGAIQDVYGVSVTWPAPTCNVTGALMYRYLGGAAGAQLFPQSGCKTHFLGRYLLKDGFPAQGLTSTDQTPAGGFPAENQRIVANFVPSQGGSYQFLIVTNLMVRFTINGVSETIPSGNQSTQVSQLVAGQTYPMIVDLINISGQWSFSLSMSVNGAAWAPIPAGQLFMPYDRRLPMFEVAFNRMPAGTTGAVQDTNGVFQNLTMTNASVGTLNGIQCMLVGGAGSGLFNFNQGSLLQGIRLRAFKSITMKIQITTNVIAGITPSLFGIYNSLGANPAVDPPHSFTPSSVVTWPNKTNAFMITTSSMKLYPYGRDPVQPVEKAFLNNIALGSATPLLGSWIHFTFVWDDDFTGYTTYVNGSQSVRAFAPAYDISTIMETMCIGCDNHPEGASWTGGIAWFRGFDYRLGPDQITMDMNDGWMSL